MRYDMVKVVIERPRSHRVCNYHDVRTRYKHLDLEDLDNLPKKQGYRRPHMENGEWKEFSDLLGPLYGFLISRIGKKWDDVYSEIRERINPNSTVQIHILSHVFQMVELHTTMVDGQPHEFSRYLGFRPINAGQIYVHPETGILLRTPEKSRRRSPAFKKAEKRLRAIFGDEWHKVPPKHAYYDEARVINESKRHHRVGSEKELHKMDGTWYWAVFADVPPPVTVGWMENGEWKERIVRRGACDYWTGVARTEGRYRSGRRQANRDDLRHYKLRNDVT